jgi:hypothetical protein
VTAHTDADLLAAVEQSPQAAARRDRSGWVGLFTDDASVEDPVGSMPHRGPEAIGLFFDTFIAPRDITFHPHADIVCGSTVIRDVTLEVRMGPAVSIDVAAILRYALVDVGGELKIRELQAFWELPPMLWRFARRGVPAVPVALGLSRAMLVNQRPRGVAGFLTGLHRPARRHRREVDTLLSALTGGDQLAGRRMLGAGSRVTAGDGDPIGVDALGARLVGARVASRITAGFTTAVSLRGADGPAVVLIDTDPWTVRLFAAGADPDQSRA